MALVESAAAKRGPARQGARERPARRSSALDDLALWQLRLPASGTVQGLNPVAHSGGVDARAVREHDLVRVAIGEPAQRRGDVRVRRGDAGVDRDRGRRRRVRRVELDVSGAAQQVRGLRQERGRVGIGAIETRGRRRPTSRRPATRRRARARCAATDRAATARAAGTVRRMPARASIMILAASMPASSEICAFQPSTGSGAAYSSAKPPAAAASLPATGDRG